MAADADVQRTLLVLFAPEAHLGAPYARRILSGAGLAVVKEEKLSGEELEEAGIDVDDGGTGDQQHQRASHLAMVVEGANAVARARELRTGALAIECPTLRVFTAPSLDAATMAIEILFPCLDEPKEEPTAVAPVTTSDAAPKPFALSNAAFEAKQEAAPAPAVERRLSPAIEKALAEVEAREEQQRLRKISRSSRGSGAASGTPSPLASRDQSRNGTDVEPTTFERRVFTRVRSPSPEPETLDGAEGTDQDPEPTTQSPSPVPEQICESLQAPIASPSRSRASSALSHLSKASSTQSATTSNGFKARPAPPSSSKPAIQPRMTKAAALRLGIALPPATPRRSTALNGPSPAATAAAPTPQASRATPRSLGQPAITPRLTKAAALRLGQPDPSAATSLTTTPRVRQSISTAERAALDRARRQSALGTATSTTTTTTTTRRGAKVVEVRMSRAALLRQGLDASAPPPSSVNRAKGVVTAGRASLSSSTSGPSTAAASGRPSTTGPGLGPVSADLKALREPAIAPRMTKAASLRTGGGGAGAKGAAGRPSLLLASSSVANARATSSSPGAGGSATAVSDRNVRPASTTGGSLSSSASASRPASSAFAGPRKSLSVSEGTITTTRTAAPPLPTLTPRLNKAAELRKAKLQETVTAGGNAAPPGSTGTAAAVPPPRKSKTLTERN
ncbi:hypothetical protein RHOSPDRAFT_31995 [Rhodotorula sp. JG-1b]|nr:hypothetical protein RHOSPDRAFT_31995 [Rhodotorula sp. JG-1b]